MDHYVDWYVCDVDVRCIAEDVERAYKVLGYEGLLAHSEELFGFTREKMEEVFDKLRSYSKREPVGKPPVGWW